MKPPGKSGLTLATLAAAALTITASAWAQGVDMNNPLLPPTGNDINGIPTGYLSPQQVHTTYSGPGLTFVLSLAIHQPFSSPPIIRIPSGPNEIEQFESGMTGLLSVNGSPDQPISGQGPVQTVVFGKTGNVTGTFQTEMLSMDLTGISPFGPFMIRESPTLQSTGQTTITPIGGGNYHIDSFFDVFTELSIDGGATWLPGVSTGPGGGTVVSLGQVPEPGSMALMATGAGLIGFRFVRRKRA